MECLECGYATTRPSQYQRHLKSNKHLAITGHACVCGNVYTEKRSLRRHEKTCTYGKPTIDTVVVQLAQGQMRQAEEQTAYVERIAEKQMSFFKEQARIAQEREERLAREQAEREVRLAERLTELHTAEIERLVQQLADRPAVSNTLNISNNSNCSFNLGLFLNERCKDAPSIEQFMKSLPIHMDSSIEMGQFFLDNLSKCAVEDRPIHCTDVKRGKLAVKHEGAWEQDRAKTDPLIAHQINLLRCRFIKHLSEVWCVENPKCMEDGPLSDEYARLYQMTCQDLDEKFHRHLAKATAIAEAKMDTKLIS